VVRERNRRCWLVLSALVVSLSPVSAQQLLDRVVARVGTVAITLSDVRAAIGLGLVETASATDAAPVQPLIDRQLMLVEVARFPPPDPALAAIDAQIETMRAHAGAELGALMRNTGIDEQRIRELARDTLRIRGYVDQRFGTSVQVTEDDVRRYYEAHAQEFTRNAMPIPFEEAAPEARRRASDERLRATVEQWLQDLRARAEVVVLNPPPGA
jgi:hypothetical protein